MEELDGGCTRPFPMICSRSSRRVPLAGPFLFMTRFKTKVMCVIGLLASASFLLALFRLPFPWMPPLKYDLADVPPLIGAFTLGPSAGLVIVLLRNVLEYLVKPNHPANFVMNVLASGNLVFCAGWFYRRCHDRQGALRGLLVGVLTTTVIMIPANLLITPLYLGVGRDQVWSMLLPAIVPFNLSKHLLTALVTFLLYKQVSPFLPHYRSDPPQSTGGSR